MGFFKDISPVLFLIVYQGPCLVATVRFPLVTNHVCKVSYYITHTRTTSPMLETDLAVVFDWTHPQRLRHVLNDVPSGG